MPTRLAVESALFDRWGGLLNFVYAAGKSTDRPVSPTGTTAIYNDPIGYGLSIFGAWPADPGAVTDGDLSRLPASNYYAFLDLAEYRLIRSLVGNFTDVTETALDLTQDWSDLSKLAQARADKLEDQYAPLINAVTSRRASSGSLRNVPPTAHLPEWRPGYGRPYGRGGYGGGIW